jgi:DNA-binding IclR family transcriptional regulator
VEDLIEPLLVKLAECAGETAAFSIFAGDGFVFKLKHEMPDSYHHIALNRKSNALFSNGIGIANLAFQDDATIAKTLSEISGDLDLAAFKKTLEKIRREEFYFSNERNGLRFLKPVFGRGGCFVGIMGVSRIDKEISDEEIESLKELVGSYSAKASEILKKKG